MKKFFAGFGLFLLGLIAVALVFCAAVLIRGAINHVGFYDQLCLWFGHGSAFAKLFIK